MFVSMLFMERGMDIKQESKILKCLKELEDDPDVGDPKTEKESDFYWVILNIKYCRFSVPQP